MIVEQQRKQFLCGDLQQNVGMPEAQPESQPLSKGTAEAAQEGPQASDSEDEEDPKLTSIKVVAYSKLTSSSTRTYPRKVIAHAMPFLNTLLSFFHPSKTAIYKRE